MTPGVTSGKILGLFLYELTCTERGFAFSVAQSPLERHQQVTGVGRLICTAGTNSSLYSSSHLCLLFLIEVESEQFRSG